MWRDAYYPEQSARRLGQVFLRFVSGADDSPAAVVLVRFRHPVLVVVAAADVHEPGVLPRRLDVEPGERAGDALAVQPQRPAAGAGAATRVAAEVVRRALAVTLPRLESDAVGGRPRLREERRLAAFVLARRGHTLR